MHYEYANGTFLVFDSCRIIFICGYMSPIKLCMTAELRRAQTLPATDYQTDVRVMHSDT